ncbi:MAG: hypothetical protein KatS3mg076_3027 [Candidatus Binatia bacterium]|nr:MAG: hypothetical protein KatS3mg076_3027 [Candidatus Binatia bacterium]
MLEAIQKANLLLAAAVAAAGWLVGLFDPWSTLLGALVMGGNVWLMERGVRLAFRSSSGFFRSFGAALVIAKFGLLLGAVALLFRFLPVEAAGFAVGVTSFLAATVVVSVRFGQTRGREG